MNPPGIQIIQPSPTEPKIIWARVPSVTIYQITENELSTLERGSPCELYLNFAIFFWTAAISFFSVLLTSDSLSVKVFTVFVVVTIVTAAAGLILGALWWRTRKSVDGVVKEIRARIKSE
jgi:hypothetical protein